MRKCLYNLSIYVAALAVVAWIIALRLAKPLLWQLTLRTWLAWGYLRGIRRPGREA